MGFIMIIILLAVFITLIMVNISIFKKGKKLWLSMIAVIIFATIVGITLYNTVFYNNQEYVEIMNSETQEFSINIKNHKNRYEYHHSVFSCTYSIEELLDEVKEQYRIAYFDERLEKIIIVEDNNIYSIENCENSKFLWTKRYKYILASNDNSIIENEMPYNIPFPNDFLSESSDESNKVMKINCDYDTLKKYYEHFTNVSYGNNTIEIQQNKNKFIVKVEGEMAYFEVAKDIE